jgi:uncharacterized protein (TIGR03437 family)
MDDQAAAPGSSILIPVALAAPDGPVGAVQFDLQYDDSVMSVAATLGDSSHSSQKSLFYTDLSPQTRRFLLVGMNENSASSGVLLNLFVNLKTSAANGVYALTFSNVSASDPAGVSTAMNSADATVTIQGTADQSIALQPAGVLNTASQLPGAVASGELITLIGAGIGPDSPIQPGGSTTEGVASVLFDGVPAPILYASSNEIHLVAPYAISGGATTNVQVVNGGQFIAGLALPVAVASPALFTADGRGVGQAAILNQDLTLNSPSNPAAAGSVLVLYATGAGQTSPPGVDGVVAGDALSTPNLLIAVQIGGVDAQVIYTGSAPGLISGVIQVNCLVPQGLPSGPALPLTLMAGTARSPIGPTVAIR